MIALLCVFIAGVVGFSLFNIISLKREQRDVIQQQKELEAEKAQLEEELAEINDPANLEEQARDQLRLIKPGEYLYMFPEEITKAAKDVQTTEEQESEEE